MQLWGASGLGANIHLKLIAHLRVGAVGRAGGEFNDAFCAAITATRAPGAQGVIDAYNSIFFVEIDYVNGDGHEHAVDAAAGINEQSVAVGQFFATDQPDEASPEGVGDGADGDEVGLCSWVIDV